MCLLLFEPQEFEAFQTVENKTIQQFKMQNIKIENPKHDQTFQNVNNLDTHKSKHPGIEHLKNIRSSSPPDPQPKQKEDVHMYVYIYMYTYIHICIM